VSWTMCGFTSAPKTPSSRVTFLVEPRIGALGAATILPHLHEAVARAGDGALHEQQVPFRVDLVHGQADLGHALAAHAAGHANPLEDPRGRGRRADRAGLADVVRAVARRPTAEVVALDRAGAALAAPLGGDLDALAG